jgi:hypothetical protein
MPKVRNVRGQVKALYTGLRAGYQVPLETTLFSLSYRRGKKQSVDKKIVVKDEQYDTGKAEEAGDEGGDGVYGDGEVEVPPMKLTITA